MSGRIERGFQTQQADNLDVKRKFAVMAKGLKEIKVVISDLGESNKKLGRRISEATSKLKAITKEARTAQGRQAQINC